MTKAAGCGLAAIALAAFGLVGARLAAQEKDAAPNASQDKRTGWISDESCKAQHVGGTGASCVEKCWRGGAAVGHPEWKPQKAVFVADDDHAIWVVANPETVKEFPAAHVEVAGKFDAEKKTVQVEKVTAK